MNNGVSITGFDEVLKTLSEMGGSLDGAIDKALLAGAEVMQEAAKQKVYTVLKRRSGNLKDNIKIGEIRETRKGKKSIVVGPDKGDISKAFYGKYSEYGTSRQKARPWLRPAFDEAAPKIELAMSEIIGNEIEAAFKK